MSDIGPGLGNGEKIAWKKIRTVHAKEKHQYETRDTAESALTRHIRHSGLCDVRYFLRNFRGHASRGTDSPAVILKSAARQSAVPC